MQNELTPYNYENQFVTLSNTLIRSKEKTNLLESKIEVLSVFRLKEEMNTVIKKDAEGKDYSVHFVELKAAEIGALQDRSMKSSSLYEDIFKISLALKEKTNIVWDKDLKGYKMVSLYDDISYRDGVLHIEFNPSSEYLFLELADNYSKLSLPILFAFKHNGGFQLYKLLKSYAYNLPPIDLSLSQEELPYYSISYSLSELRLSLGYVDLTQVDIDAEAHKKHPNFEKMDDMDKTPRYKRWGDFNERVISPGKKEINKQSDIYIAKIEPIRSGRGGKISDIVFYIQHNLAYYKNLEIVSDNSAEEDRDGLKKYKVIKDAMSRNMEPGTEEDEMVNTLYDYFAEAGISRKQCLILLKDAKYDVDLIIATYRKAKEQPYIRDLIAWMRAALKDGGYEEQISMSRGDAEKGQKVYEAEEQYKKIRTDSSLKEKVWNRYKEREDFEDFIEYVGLPEEMIEAMPVDGRLELFSDYIRKE